MLVQVFFVDQRPPLKDGVGQAKSQLFKAPYPMFMCGDIQAKRCRIHLQTKAVVSCYQDGRSLL